MYNIRSKCRSSRKKYASSGRFNHKTESPLKSRSRSRSPFSNDQDVYVNSDTYYKHEINDMELGLSSQKNTYSSQKTNDTKNAVVQNTNADLDITNDFQSNLANVNQSSYMEIVEGTFHDNKEAYGRFSPTGITDQHQTRKNVSKMKYIGGISEPTISRTKPFLFTEEGDLSSMSTKRNALIRGKTSIFIMDKKGSDVSIREIQIASQQISAMDFPNLIAIQTTQFQNITKSLIGHSCMIKHENKWKLFFV